jgi:hypothetical protein
MYIALLISLLLFGLWLYIAFYHNSQDPYELLLNSFPLFFYSAYLFDYDGTYFAPSHGFIGGALLGVMQLGWYLWHKKEVSPFILGNNIFLLTYAKLWVGGRMLLSLKKRSAALFTLAAYEGLYNSFGNSLLFGCIANVSLLYLFFSSKGFIFSDQLKGRVNLIASLLLLVATLCAFAWSFYHKNDFALGVIVPYLSLCIVRLLLIYHNKPTAIAE